MPQKIQVVTGTDAEGKPILAEMEVPTAEEMAELQRKLAAANHEAMQRRLQLEAKEKEKPQGENNPEQGNPQATPQPTPAPVKVEINEDEIVAKAVAALEKKNAAEAQKQRELDALIQKHNLAPQVRNVLAQSLDPAAAAAELEQAGLTFAGGNSGSAGKKTNSVSAAAKSAFEALDLEFED